MQNVSHAKRIVVKVGTSTLTHDNQKTNLRSVRALCRTLADLKNEGRDVILVSSGAISAGTAKLKLAERPKEMRLKQAAAAVGQCELMHLYDNCFEEYGQTVAQVLLTNDCIDDPQRRENVANTFESLLELGAIPIVNENDTVSVEEITDVIFSENDTLSAIVARLCKADLLIRLSDIDGLYDGDPREHPDASLIPVVYEMTPRIRKAAAGSGTNRGKGGMITKINAAEVVTQAGIPMIIMNGSDPENLYKIFDGESIGTLFLPQEKEETE